MTDAERGSEGKSKRQLGEYRVVAELARGGMGKVYLAQRSGQAGFERNFAIKVMHQQLSENPDAVLMLLDEAHIASKLHHPNVVPVLDIGSCDEGHYLVMDYVEGCSLQQLIKASPNFRPAPAIASIMLGALRGLHAVHTLKGVHGEAFHVVHRDVSPHNLLLGVDGGCRVSDFGIAKARQRFTDTQAGMHKGKLAFMSPEQIMGSNSIDCRTDIWSAGVTLYVALTGQHPFRRGNDGATLHAILSAEILPPSRVGLFPPPCFDDVVMRALEREPEARYASAEEFADALRTAALNANMLGSPSDVAKWVEAYFGETLNARRRMLAAIPRQDEGQTASRLSLPKLWFSSDASGSWSQGSNSGVESEAASRDTESQLKVDAPAGGKFRPLRPSTSTAMPERPSRKIAVGVIAAALLIGGGLAYTTGGPSSEARTNTVDVAAPPTQQGPTPAPAAMGDTPSSAPALAPVEAEQPVAPKPAPALGVKAAAWKARMNAEADSQPVLDASAGAAPAHPLKASSPKQRPLLEAAGPQSSSAPREPAAPVEHSAPARPSAAPKEPTVDKANNLDRNPYLLGE